MVFEECISTPKVPLVAILRALNALSISSVFLKYFTENFKSDNFEELYLSLDQSVLLPTNFSTEFLRYKTLERLTGTFLGSHNSLQLRILAPDLHPGEWIHLKRGLDRRGCGPIGLRGHGIMLCGGVRLPSGESGGARNCGWSQGRPEAALMCLDSLRLPNCARNPHVLSQGCAFALEFIGGQTLGRAQQRIDLSLREIVLEREPIPLIDLSDSESVEGPVAPRIGLGALIEEDPSEPE
ncbi:hypothetical protein M9H77_02623 [Catharanthus roseus]|uniref:Uncharacterized protein n=1 Tax=Catharanthus roseus TaxID=4058 RepID=A0ACC0C8Z4_CATRO|nr:hypothetical protein M9H77_02623 [Catharanthus roseus]